ERLGPQVLPDEERGGRVRLEGVGGVLDVVVGDQTTDVAVDVSERRQHLVLVELDRDVVAVSVLGDEHQGEDADGAVLDPIAERGRDLAVELVAGKSDDEVLDGSNTHDVILLLIVMIVVVTGRLAVRAARRARTRPSTRGTTGCDRRRTAPP